jgi:hypothetical protein
LTIVVFPTGIEKPAVPMTAVLNRLVLPLPLRFTVNVSLPVHMPVPVAVSLILASAVPLIAMRLLASDALQAGGVAGVVVLGPVGVAGG